MKVIVQFSSTSKMETYVFVEVNVTQNVISRNMQCLKSTRHQVDHLTAWRHKRNLAIVDEALMGQRTDIFSWIVMDITIKIDATDEVQAESKKAIIIQPSQ